MKKLFILAVTLCLACGTGLAQQYAQDKCIYFLKGGTSGIIQFDDNTPTLFTLGGGYFPAQNFLLGADITYTNINSTNTSDISGRPFMRYYFNETVFLGAGGFVREINDEYKVYPDAELGYLIYLNNYVTFEPTLYYRFEEDYPVSFLLTIGIYL